MSCNTCHSFSYEASGGLSIAGSAPVTGDTIREGGITLGGIGFSDSPGDFGLQAWWLLAEAGTGVADEFIDQGRYSIDGTGGGEVPTRINGLRCLYAQEFAGRDYIDINANTLPMRAVSCWLRIDSWYEDRTVFKRPGFRLGFSVLRQPYLEVTDGTSTSTVYASQSLRQESWHHVAASWHPGGSMKIFIDGKLSTSATTSVATLASGSGGSAFIGRRDQSFPQMALMDLRIFSDERFADWWLMEYRGICNGLTEPVGDPEEV